MSHVRRYHRHYRSSGHVWQGRFRAFPIHEDEHLLRVVRYVERNGLRANLVRRAQDWVWSSLRWWLEPGELPFLDPGPVARSAQRLEVVNTPQTEAKLERLRHSVRRGTPFGPEAWVRETAVALGLKSTLRPQGQPRKEAQESEHPQTPLLF